MLNNIKYTKICDVEYFIYNFEFFPRQGSEIFGPIANKLIGNDKAFNNTIKSIKEHNCALELRILLDYQYCIINTIVNDKIICNVGDNFDLIYDLINYVQNYTIGIVKSDCGNNFIGFEIKDYDMSF